jgi:hypothetical protein
MSLTDFRLRLRWPSYRESLDKLRPTRGLFRNFQSCPHCERMGRYPIIERLNEAGPVVSRSDGKTFHLVLGDRPISFPAEKSSGRTEMKSAGFWYITERNGSTNAFTQTVVVILRKAPQNGVSLFRHLEMVADALAEKLAKPEPLETLYEFEGNRLHRVW